MYCTPTCFFCIFYEKVLRIALNHAKITMFEPYYPPEGGVPRMGKICEVCGKGTMSGNHVSHANNAVRRCWAPNTQKVRVIVDGAPKTMYVCTRCLRSGKVERNV